MIAKPHQVIREHFPVIDIDGIQAERTLAKLEQKVVALVSDCI